MSYNVDDDVNGPKGPSAPSEDFTPKSLISLLRQRGVSKWEIAKRMGVSWQTVHCWEREWFKPDRQKWERLLALQAEGDIRR